MDEKISNQLKRVTVEFLTKEDEETIERKVNEFVHRDKYDLSNVLIEDEDEEESGQDRESYSTHDDDK